MTSLSDSYWAEIEERNEALRIRGEMDRAQTEDQYLDALRSAGSLRTGIALVREYAPHRPNYAAEYALMDDEELAHCIVSVGKSLALWEQREGKGSWQAVDCRRALSFARDAMADRCRARDRALELRHPQCTRTPGGPECFSRKDEYTEAMLCAECRWNAAVYLAEQAEATKDAS